MYDELDKKAKKEMLKELQRVMKKMMLEDGEDALPVAAEVSVMKAEPVGAEEMEMVSESSESLEEEEELDLSDPEMIAKFKEFLKMKKDM